MSALRLAYADPPYPGCAHLYPENAEVDHAELVARLVDDYDGWALSTNENALRDVIALCPPSVRVLAWCKSNAPPFYSTLIPSWEPVLVMRARDDGAPVRSYLESAAPTGVLQGDRLPGQKSAAFCRWILRCIGAREGDALTDLFPGTGIMGETWRAYAAQAELPLYLRNPRREVLEKLRAVREPALWEERPPP